MNAFIRQSGITAYKCFPPHLNNASALTC